MKPRRLVPELMDDPNLDTAVHHRALNGLRRVNMISRTASAIAKTINKYCEQSKLSTARILDLGCGSGDVAYGVARSMPANSQWHIEGWDISGTAIDYARQLHGSGDGLKRQASIRFHQQDIFTATSPPFDFVYCSLFLHHFSDSDAIRVLRRMKGLARQVLIVDDLDRSVLGYTLASIGVRLLSRSPIVHFDGPQSVRAAFTMNEVKTLARAAGLERFEIGPRWPQRWLLAAELFQ